MAHFTKQGLKEARRARSEAKGAIGTTLMGGRKDFVSQARALVESARATVQSEMATPESVQEFCQTINYGASRRVMDRTCIQLKAHILKLLDVDKLVLVEFVKSTGASSEGELRRMVEAYRSAGEADTLTAIERMCTALEAMLPMHEDVRAMVVRRLGGYMPTGVFEAVGEEVAGVPDAES